VARRGGGVAIGRRFVATLGFALAAGVYGNGIDKGEARLLAATIGGCGTARSDGEHEVA
jgi:hypothetical protein